MKKIIESILALIISLIGAIGGIIWICISKWDMEPIILTSISFAEIIGYIIVKLSSTPIQENANESKEQRVINEDNVGQQINIQENNGDIQM